jgi:hypothetical protein
MQTPFLPALLPSSLPSQSESSGAEKANNSLAHSKSLASRAFLARVSQSGETKQDKNASNASSRALAG